MHSPKKSLIPTIPKSVIYSYSNRNILRKKCAFSQTNRNSYLDLFQGSNILTFDEESKKLYVLALEYVNKFHNFMNKELNEKYGECGDASTDSDFFKLPEIPNYANLFQMLLEKTKRKNVLKKTEEVNRHTDVLRALNKPSVIEFITDISECKTLEKQFKSNQVLNIKNNKPNFEIVRNSTIPEIPVPISNKSEFILKEENLNFREKVVIYSQNLVTEDDTEENNAAIESNNILDSEKYDDEDLVEDEPMKKVTEEKTNEKLPNDENKYTNHVIDKDLTDVEKKNFMELVKRRVEEEFLTYLNKNNTEKPKDTRLVKSNFNIVTIQPQINLLEYAQKKLERQTNLEVDSSKSVNRCNELHHNDYFPTCNSPENYNTPKRIRDMFKKISQENFENTADNCVTHINLFEGESDSDSIILDDEEFEKLNRGFQEKQNVDDDEFKIKGFQQKSDVKKEGRRQKKNNSVPGPSQEKCHPLMLNGKDMTRLDEKMLSAIGLFTERGDMRPGIIDILEEQKRAKSKDARNKQFRTKRQWDLQIHLEPKTYLRPSLTSISSDKSFISLSSDVKSEIEQKSGKCRK